MIKTDTVALLWPRRRQDLRGGPSCTLGKVGEVSGRQARFIVNRRKVRRVRVPCSCLKPHVQAGSEGGGLLRAHAPPLAGLQVADSEMNNTWVDLYRLQPLHRHVCPKPAACHASCRRGRPATGWASRNGS